MRQSQRFCKRKYDRLSDPFVRLIMKRLILLSEQKSNGYETKMTDKVILVRHGTRTRDVYAGEKQHGLEGFYPGDQDKWPPAKFDGSGTQVVLAMAGRLADKLVREGVMVAKILHSEHVVAAQTAEIS